MIDWHFFSFKNEFLILNWIETVSGVGVIAYTMCVSECPSVCIPLMHTVAEHVSNN